MDGKEMEMNECCRRSYQMGYEQKAREEEARRHDEAARIIARCTTIPKKTGTIVPGDIEEANRRLKVDDGKDNTAE